MLKVLLVDDEPFILQGLTVLVDWQKEGFEIAGIRKNFYTDPIENGVIYTKYF